MSGAAGPEEVVRSAVPIPDLSSVDVALHLEGDALRAALKRVRPALVAGADLYDPVVLRGPGQTFRADAALQDLSAR